MSAPDTYDLFRTAITEYAKDKGLHTVYQTSFHYNADYGSLGVFDPPADCDPSLGLLQDGPEYWAKPVLIARLDKTGKVFVETTEYTAKYLVSQNNTNATTA